MQRSEIFSYAWHVDEDEPDVTVMRIYGLNKKNENVCIRINNFTPYVYLELPEDINWTESRAAMVGAKIDFILGQKKPLVKCLIFKKRLYYVQEDKTGKRKKFPYLFCSFSSPGDIKILSYKIRRPVRVNGLGLVRMKIHEHNASPFLQYTSQRKIPTAGWIEFDGKKIPKDEQKTLCDHEYVVRWKNTRPKKNLDIVAKPLIMGFDIEVNSSNPARMPNAEKPADKVFQISCILSRHGDPPEKYKKYLLTLGQPDFKILGKDVEPLMFESEADLLMGFTEFVKEHNPNVLVGYNILGFDIPYMIERAKHNICIYDFDQLGFLKFAHAKEKTISWSSSAYKNQNFQFLDAEGRLFVDLLPLVKRDYKFNNYKLKTVASFFLKGLTKDDLDPQGIFKCYRIGMKGGKRGSKAMGVVGKYCVQDSVLMNMLFEKLQTWIGLCEMATVCNVPVFYLYTKGQQIKVFSQLYKKCTHENIVVEKDGYTPGENDHYVGATVFPPVPGVYDRVVPFDFSSLYPTTIIAYNLDYSTLVLDPNIPDERCHVMEWEDHVGCEHDPKVVRKTELTQYINTEMKNLTKLRDTKKGKKGAELEEIKQEVAQRVKALKPYREERAELNKSKPKNIMCTPRKFRWLKEPIGVLPSLLKNLLEARKHTKGEIKALKKRLKEEKMTDKERVAMETALTVLDKRQLAYKVSANSGYGATGVQRGFLPMMPVAMCTTYMGRKSIELVADVIPRKFKGQLVYGDTDSNYIAFPHLADKTAAEIWDYSEHVAAEVTKLFPPPMNLAFEEVIYWRFFILTKKRYMSLACYRDGKVSDDIKKKGVLLARRDNCQFIRDIYATVILKIFHRETREQVLDYVIDEMNKLCSGYYPCTKFVMTQAVGDTSGLMVVPFINEKGQKKGKVGDYTVPLLPDDEKEQEKKLKGKKASTAHEYYLRSLPAHVQLAEKMRRRGQRAEPGTRLEYIVTTEGGHTAKKYEKIESADYYKKHSDILKIDYLYYLFQLTNHLDQVLNVMYDNPKEKPKYKHQHNFTLEQYKYRSRIRQKNLEKIRSLFRPRLNFDK